MGPMWAEMVANILPIIDADDRTPPPNRLALFSGHDTTIMPLLISLGPNVWDGTWPPYASMMIIEVCRKVCALVCSGGPFLSMLL